MLYYSHVNAPYTFHLFIFIELASAALHRRVCILPAHRPKSSIYKYIRVRGAKKCTAHIWCNIIPTERRILNGFSMGWSDGYDFFVVVLSSKVTNLPT